MWICLWICPNKTDKNNNFTLKHPVCGTGNVVKLILNRHLRGKNLTITFPVLPCTLRNKVDNFPVFNDVKHVIP